MIARKQSIPKIRKMQIHHQGSRIPWDDHQTRKDHDGPCKTHWNQQMA